MRKLKDKSKKLLKAAQTRVRPPLERLKKAGLQPELVKVEVTNEAGKLLLLYKQNLVGSATDAFIALQKLTDMLRNKRTQDQDMHHI
jgi:hypothetical protein